MSYIDFSIFDNQGKPIQVYKSTACFYNLHDLYFTIPEDSYVTYFIKSDRTTLNEKQIQWFHSELNKIGLISEMTLNKQGLDDTFEFKVDHKGYNCYTLFLATLVALRYLEEDDLPKMVKWAFDNKNKDENFFNLLQMMHYSYSNNNSNHTFLSGHTVYGNRPTKLIALEDFHANMEKQGVKYRQTPGDYETGTSKIMTSNESLSQAVTSKTLRDMLNSGNYSEAKALLTK